MTSIVLGPGQKMVLIHGDPYAWADALLVRGDFVATDHQWGINCSIFRNESGTPSSTLILEAEEVFYMTWD